LKKLLLALIVAIGLLLAMHEVLIQASSIVGFTKSPASIITVCPDGPPACDHSTIQDAVDTAQSGDEIRVATGVYTDVRGLPAPPGYPDPPVSGLITQVVYLSKTLTIRGGYTISFTNPPDPETNPTTLDAQDEGRVLFTSGPMITVTVEGLRFTGGDSTGLGGDSPYASGGGAYIFSATVTLSSCQVVSNAAPGSGGGIYSPVKISILSIETLLDGGVLVLCQTI